MLRIATVLMALCASLSLSAQTGVISGVVSDEITKETLIQATVLVGDQGILTDFDGKFSVELPYGTYTVKVSYVGYEAKEITVELDRPVLVVNLSLSSILLREAEVVADVAIERETPVAFSNIKPVQIEEELGSQPVPMILNSTPGVYATQNGSDDSGPSVSIRGFKQRNVSVMIDGIPVNDMEDGRVFWNNWFGLDLVTKTMQVQRGLGASKLALPAIGGTVNIITQGIESKAKTSVKQEVGSFGMLRTTFGHTTGRTPKGWGLTIAGSYKRDRGWAEETRSEAWFYYAKVQKELGNHLISVSAMGAPSLNYTRSYQQRIVTHDKDYARSLFTGSEDEYNTLMGYSSDYREIYSDQGNNVFATDDEGNIIYDENGTPRRVRDLMIDTLNTQYGYSSVDQFLGIINQTSFIDTSGAVERGLRYNMHWGEMNGQVVNERQNKYHKPLFSFRHSWNISDKLFLSNIAYYSYGVGGGTSLSPGLGSGDYDEFGQIDFQRFFTANTTSFSSIDPLYSDTERKAGWILRKGFNNHYWLGLLSTFRYDHSERWTFSGGVDARSYKAEHYAEVFDLLGADYYVPTNYPEGEDPVKRVGDIIDYHNEVYVRWGGAFLLAEYKGDVGNAFVNVSGVYQGYNRYDYFIESEDTELTGATKETGWVWRPGFTAKFGGNYLLSEWSNVFMNVGHLNRTPVSQNVIGFDNQVVDNIENEKVNSIELGYSFSKYPFSFNVNAYFTEWNNRPLNSLLRVETPEGNIVRANINAMSALHKGIEFDGAYKMNQSMTLEGFISIGDWVWTSSEDSLVLIDELTNLPYNDPSTGNPMTIQYDANGVSVGDSPQSQYGMAFKYAHKSGFYIKPRYTYFHRHYGDFDPFSLYAEDSGRQSWEIPGYGLLDLHTGYSFDLKESQIDVRLSVFNVLNKVYIINAQNNDALSEVFYRNPQETYPFSENNFDASSASVYMGYGLRSNFSVRVRF